MERFVAGSLAGVIAQSSIYPMEVRPPPPPPSDQFTLNISIYCWEDIVYLVLYVTRAHGAAPSPGVEDEASA